jgi:2-oxoglutarate dehydrogenase E2 component (dihydrolipoamide succinyltransferase)
MPEPTPVFIPKEDVNDETVTLVAWRVMPGSHVEAGQVLADVESSKAVFEIFAPVAGVVQYTLMPGQEVEVGGALCTIYSNATMPLLVEEASVPLETNQPVVGEAYRVGVDQHLGAETVSISVAADSGPISTFPAPVLPRFSQKAEALLQQHGINPQVFTGQGLVRVQQVLAVLRDKGVQADNAPSASQERHEEDHIRPEPIPALRVPVRTVKLSRSKQTEVRYLTSSYYNTLNSVVTVAVPTRGLRAAAEQYAHFSGSPTAIILFEAARLLHKYPAFNAFYARGAMHVYEEVNIGFALDAGHGLKVPVLRQADTKSLQELVNEMRELLLSYLDDKLRVDSLTGGTFTITDLSAEGAFTFHPLINHGQSAILGVGGEFFLPGSRDGIFNLILSFDHQLAEGRQAIQFLQDLARRLQAYTTVFENNLGCDVKELNCARCLTPLSRMQRLDSAHRGDQFLVQTVQPDGRLEYRCNTCLQGW